MIVIKNYSKELEEHQINFAKEYWTKKRRFTPEYIYWKFRGEEDKELKSFILAFDDDKVVGQFGLVPCKVLIEGNIYDAQWACDLMVAKEYRGKGIADRLYEFAHENCLITLGSDPSPAAEKSMLKKGYISMTGPRKFILPIKIGEIFKLKGYNNAFLNFFYNPFLFLLKLFPSSNFVQIKNEDYLLLYSKQNRKEIHCYYDNDFLNWRFASFKDYYKGINCFKKNDSTFFSGYFANGIYYLTDFCSDTIFQFLSIINFIRYEHRNEKLLRIKFVCMNKSISSVLPFLGFIRFGTLTKVILFTKEKKIRKKAQSSTFYYTLFDSDENI